MTCCLEHQYVWDFELLCAFACVEHLWLAQTDFYVNDRITSSTSNLFHSLAVKILSKCLNAPSCCCNLSLLLSQELSGSAGSFWLCLTGVKLSSDQSPALLH